MARSRVLVVYSRVGGGHLSAARALAAELESSGKATVNLVDAYLECGQFPTTRFPAAYAWLARSQPGLWAKLYQGAAVFDPSRALEPFLIGGFRRVIGALRPSVVVSVLPVINGILGRAAHEAAVRTEVVLTDWHKVHRSWVAPGVDHYVAPTESARQDCIRFGAAAEAVEVIGIPVRRDFAMPTDADTARHRLVEVGLAADTFTILAMVGAEGSPRAFANIARLAQLRLDGQMLVICGHNSHLRQRVEGLAAQLPLRTVGFVDNVAELMRASDVVVTKAGGMTLAEAFCARRATVVHDVLAGQESGNLEYVLSQEAVLFASDSGALARLIEGLFADPSGRAALAARGARLARPPAAHQIVAGLLARLAA